MTDESARPFDQSIRIGLLRLGAIILVPLLILTHPYFRGDGLIYEVMEVVGTLLIIACVLGRFWAILYVGKHKNRGVVTDGPYSVSRNPLYFFSTLGAFGVGLLFGKLTLALVLGIGVFAILSRTALKEQAYLSAWSMPSGCRCSCPTRGASEPRTTSRRQPVRSAAIFSTPSSSCRQSRSPSCPRRCMSIPAGCRLSFRKIRADRGKRLT
jgi:protein-S-isoprenylcysteine O-methyltransferase Ste14